MKMNSRFKGDTPCETFETGTQNPRIASSDHATGVECFDIPTITRRTQNF